jgi:hypothetical protein
MQWVFRWLFRPTILVVFSGFLAVGAAVLMFWPGSDQAGPLPVGDSDQEIAWLSPATNVRDWERFVTAVATAVRRAKNTRTPLEVDDTRAFPRETTEVPELRLRVAGKDGWLLFRWYKLTGDLKGSYWIKALVERRPPPLAVIGGSNSQGALELARRLREEARGPSAPLFLITQATADNDPSTPSRLPLPSIYPGRTFRFCFTNRQMAQAVATFVWNRDNLLPAGDPLRQLTRFLWDQDGLPPAEENLRPDADPAYMAIWEDDPYSQDLADHFLSALRRQAVHSTALDWAWLTGFAAQGGVPIELAGVRRGQFRMVEKLPWQVRIFHSVGSFNRPNRAEERAVDALLDQMARQTQAGQPQQQRPLLVVPATSQPCRRFLRALRKSAPVTARRFVVVTGDSIEFNKIYRDRNLTWPIQELPLKLVFFCHRNPVDREAGFRELNEVGDYDFNQGSPTTGTEDLLLFRDVVETVVQAAYRGERLLSSADALRDNFRVIEWKKGRLLFGPRGNRHSGTGEHVVYLRPPLLRNNRVAPKSEIEIWSRFQDVPGKGANAWVLTRYLSASYDSGSGEGDPNAPR